MTHCILFFIFFQAGRKERTAVAYQQFRRQLFHACLAYIYMPLKPFMTSPEVVRCPDGHFRRSIFSIGPYIADYPEQVWLTAIVSDWCPTWATSLFFLNSLDAWSYIRCDAKPSNLDDNHAHLRTYEKTDFLLGVFDPGIVWDEYGLRSDVVVSHSLFYISS